MTIIELPLLNKILAEATIQFALRHSEYGTPQPSLRVSVPRGTGHHRSLSIVLHLLAAAIEAASRGKIDWAVCIQERHEEIGRVYLELATGSQLEVEAGSALLRAFESQ